MNQKELKEYMDNLYFDMRDNIKYKDYMIQKFYNMKNNNEKLENVIYGLLDEIVTMSENYNILEEERDSLLGKVHENMTNQADAPLAQCAEVEEPIAEGDAAEKRCVTERNGSQPTCFGIGF